MSDKTFLPIGSDPFIDKLDYLNTGAVGEGDNDLFLFYGEVANAPHRNSNERTGRPKNANGQYSSFPGATPKYARHIPGRNRENFDTLARMYIRVPKVGRADRIYKNLKNAVSKDVAKVLIGDGSAASPALGYVDFFLDTIQSNLSEKVQVTEVLEDNFVAFFFGASPPTYTFTGHLMNTLQDDWAVQMLSAYQDLFRGTMLARRGLQLYIRYDSYIVSGACLSLSLTRSASNENIIPFAIQMLVNRQHLLYGNAFGATQLPQSAGAFIPENAEQLSEPKVRQLRPLIAKAAKVPTDAINYESCIPPQEWEKDAATDDRWVEGATTSDATPIPEVIPNTRPGPYAGPEPRPPAPVETPPAQQSTSKSIARDRALKTRPPSAIGEALRKRPIQGF